MRWHQLSLCGVRLHEPSRHFLRLPLMQNRTQANRCRTWVL